MDSELGAVVDLMSWSPVHRPWTVADIERLVVPPIQLQQRCFVVDQGALVAWGSWAWLSREAEEGYFDGTRKLQANDWQSGLGLWLVDAIAPFGHARQLTSLIRSTLRSRGKENWYIHFIRTANGKRRFSKALL